jgi:hypothetical protein
VKEPILAVACLFMLGTQARAQVKDMPSQAELDPILENVDNKLKDLITTLTEFRVEAVAMDRERLDKDLEDFRKVRKVTQLTSADGNSATNRGINMERLVLILGGLDDATLEAAIWKNLADLKMCMQMIQQQDPSRYKQFSTQMAMELGLLHEVGRQLLSPTLRMADAADEIMLAIADAASKGQPKLR